MKFKGLALILALSLSACHVGSDYFGDRRTSATPMEYYMPSDPVLDEYSQGRQ